MSGGVYCLSGHEHLTQHAQRGCNAFGRAYARFERIDARYRGPDLWADDRAFALWRSAGNLVDALFRVAMSDVPTGGRR
jgi:hypothetical protein